MGSHLRGSGARGGLLAAALVYGLAAAVVPASHFAAEAAEAAVPPVEIACTGATLGELPFDPAPDHFPEDVECLLCAALSSPAHPTTPELAPPPQDDDLVYAWDLPGAFHYLPPFASPARAPPQA